MEQHVACPFIQHPHERRAGETFPEPRNHRVDGGHASVEQGLDVPSVRIAGVRKLDVRRLGQPQLFLIRTTIGRASAVFEASLVQCLCDEDLVRRHQLRGPSVERLEELHDLLAEPGELRLQPRDAFRIEVLGRRGRRLRARRKMRVDERLRRVELDVALLQDPLNGENLEFRSLFQCPPPRDSYHFPAFSSRNQA